MKKIIISSLLVPITLLFVGTTFATEIISLKSLQSNKIVRAGVGSGTRLAAVSNQTKAWEKFNLIKLGGGIVALKSTHNGKYVRAGVGNSSYLAAVSNHAQAWERFRMIDLGNHTIALQSEHNGKYVRAGIGNASYLGAVSSHISSWEKFRIIPIAVSMADKFKKVNPTIPSGSLALNKQKLCKDYAITAVKQNQQAIQLKCGFWGPRWDSNHQSHFNWCMANNVNMQALNNEANARNADLKSCGKNAKKEDKDKLLAAIGGFIIGAIMANQNNTQNDQASYGQGSGDAHTNWCYNRYKSYRASDNTYQPYYGPRRHCTSPYN